MTPRTIPADFVVKAVSLAASGGVDLSISTLLAACGWSIVNNDNKDGDDDDDAAICCTYCARQLRFSSFTRVEQTAAARVGYKRTRAADGDDVVDNDGGGGDACASKRQRTTMTSESKRRRVAAATRKRYPLDPVASHRHFCPWVNAYVSEDDSGADFMSALTPVAAADGSSAGASKQPLRGWQVFVLKVHAKAASAAATTNQQQSPQPLQQQQQQQSLMTATTTTTTTMLGSPAADAAASTATNVQSALSSVRHLLFMAE
jgi:hypothetical protein